MKLGKNLREFIELLNSHSVEYLVVDGHAVAFHGHPRFTGGIDFFVAAAPLTADQLIQVLDTPNRIDIATGIEAMTFHEAWEKRIAGDLDGMPVYFINRDQLLKNKRAAGRPKDLADVDALEHPDPDTLSST